MIIKSCVNFCITEANSRKKKVYEQQENEENPLRCPVKLYEFYISKWLVILLNKRQDYIAFKFQNNNKTFCLSARNQCALVTMCSTSNRRGRVSQTPPCGIPRNL